MEWEVALIEWLEGLGSFTKIIANIFTFIGGEYGLLLTVLILMFCWKKEPGKRIALTVTAVNVFAPMIKACAKRLRPYMEHPDRIKPGDVLETKDNAMDVAVQGYSFPSTHSASAVSIYGSLAREVKKKPMWIISGAISLLVGLSRIALGMHYPTDVIAGWVLGVIGIAVLSLLFRIRKEWLRNLIILAAALTGILFVRTEDYFTSLGLLIGLVIAMPFEEKYVKYKDTRYIPAMILRPLLSFVIYFVLNPLLKLPFSDGFLSDGSLLSFLVRTLRYAVIVFVITGVYPMAFPLFEKKEKKGGE
ncbi:MAG: phosphatase PAP2 family protein [Christensenellaceae bacterium]|nr:phosphatase PAP2 family protein [Christensenellaceae bacterium]